MGKLDGKTQKEKQQSFNAFLKPINQYKKILRLKTTGTFEKETSIPLKLITEKNWRCPKIQSHLDQFLQLLIHACRRLRKRGIILIKNSKISSFVVKTLLESNCKRCRNTARRQNLNVQPDRYTKKTHSNKQRSYIHQYKEVKEKLHSTSFLYVRTTFEHKVQDTYASKKNFKF